MVKTNGLPKVGFNGVTHVRPKGTNDKHRYCYQMDKELLNNAAG